MRYDSGVFLCHNFVQITKRKINIIMKQRFFRRYQIASRGTTILTSQAERIIFHLYRSKHLELLK